MLNKMDDCLHKSTVVISGMSVCQDCGLELGKEFVNSDFVSINSIRLRLNKSTSNKQYVSMGNILRIPNGLGTIIKSPYKDCYGNKLNVKTSHQFNRFRSRAFVRSNTKTERMLYMLNDIRRYLDIPIYIIDSTALRYRKLANSNVRIPNHVVCVGFCLWDSIRHYKHIIHFKEMAKAFTVFGHRVPARSMLREGANYREALFKFGFEKTLPKSPRDYINRHINALRCNLRVIQKRLIYKNNYTNPKIYVNNLETKAHEILNKLNAYIMARSLNPYTTAVSSIYFAGQILDLAINGKTVLTFKLLSELCGVPEYTIRETNKDVFKDYYSLMKLKLNFFYR